MLRLCSMYYRQSFELQSSVLAAHLAVIRGRSVAYTPMQTVRYQCGLASQFTQFTGPAVPATLHSCEAAARCHRMSDMSASMAGDAGGAGDGAGPGDPSSAAPSPASASGVATTSTSTAHGRFRPPVFLARFLLLRRS